MVIMRAACGWLDFLLQGTLFLFLGQDTAHHSSSSLRVEGMVRCSYPCRGKKPAEHCLFLAKPTSGVRSHSRPSRSDVLNRNFQVHRLMEGFGFEAGNRE